MSLDNGLRFAILILKTLYPIAIFIIFVMKGILLGKILIEQRKNTIVISMTIVAILPLVEYILSFVHYMLFQLQESPFTIIGRVNFHRKILS